MQQELYQLLLHDKSFPVPILRQQIEGQIQNLKTKLQAEKDAKNQLENSLKTLQKYAQILEKYEFLVKELVHQLPLDNTSETSSIQFSNQEKFRIKPVTIVHELQTELSERYEAYAEWFRYMRYQFLNQFWNLSSKTDSTLIFIRQKLLNMAKLQVKKQNQESSKYNAKRILKQFEFVTQKQIPIASLPRTKQVNWKEVEECYQVMSDWVQTQMSDDSSSDEEFVVEETKVQKPMGLASLSGLKNLETRRHEQKVQEEESAEGDSAIIIFQLPNGEAKRHEVRMNKVIENLKVMIEKEYGIPFENQELLVEGKAQPNVFALSDIKSIQVGKENIIVVKEK